MIKVKNILEYLNTMAPFDNKCEWDNCGLLVGDCEAETNKIGFTLDLTPAVLENAKKNGVDLIVTHHPVIFKAQKNFLKGNLAFEAAKAGINVISSHTCYDCAKCGVSDVLAQTLGLEDITEVETEEKPSCVRIGLCAKCTPMQLAETVADKLGTTVRLAKGKRNIGKVAVCGGSGGDFILDAVKAGADAYVTGDVSHHHFLLAEQIGITIIGAGHYETENPAVFSLMNKVCAEFSEIIGIYLGEENPVEFIGKK
ncbi:MAG: Nif3-like dinuclear metal center hexameric protein [Oscillospiraceae bacterium]|nr:Nif3-like dinuclear metal center hexameric protein [Oscillospiraceae bacterium]